MSIFLSIVSVNRQPLVSINLRILEILPPHSQTECISPRYSTGLVYLYCTVCTLLELSSCACHGAQGTRRPRLHLWGVCDPGCAATREKTQSCPATGTCTGMCQKRASHRHPSPPREHGILQ